MITITVFPSRTGCKDPHLNGSDGGGKLDRSLSTLARSRRLSGTRKRNSTEARQTKGSPPDHRVSSHDRRKGAALASPEHIYD